MSIAQFEDDDPKEGRAITKEDIPQENVPYGVLSLKLKRQFFAVAEVTAVALLKQKKLYSVQYDMRTIHVFDYNFRVKFYHESKLKHNILVKMDKDFKVVGVVFDH